MANPVDKISTALSSFLGLPLRVLAVATLVSIAPHARAEDIEAFEGLMDQGHTEFDHGRYDAALSAFRDASPLSECPTGLLWVAKSLEKLNRTAEAFDQYELVAGQALPADAPSTCVDAKKQAEAAAATLRTGLGWVEITAVGLTKPLLHVTLNARQRAVTTGAAGAAADASLALQFRVATEPGAYTLDFEGLNEPVNGTVQAREVASVRIDLRPVETKPSSTAASLPSKTVERLVSEPDTSRPPLAWATLGLGIAGFAVAGISSWQVYDKVGDLKARQAGDCNQKACSSSFIELRSSANTWAMVANGGALIGAVGVAGGLWWLLMEPAEGDRAKASRMRWMIAPTSVAAEMSW